MTTDPDTIQQWIDDVSNYSMDLTPWEEDFIDSIAEQFEERGTLTDRQIEILERIYAEKTP
jgi:hypothetical protein